MNSEDIKEKIKIVPAILEQDFEKVKKYLDDFSKVTISMQIDVCEAGFLEKVNKNTGAISTWLPNTQDDLSGYLFDLEFDMMVSDIEKYLDIIYYYDAKKIVLHTRCMSIEDYKSIYNKIKAKNKLVSVGISDVDIEKIKSLYGFYDYVQLMGIEQIGMQGQIFDRKVLDKISELKSFLDLKEVENLEKEKEEKGEEEKESQNSKNICIQIDGAMNLETIKLCKAFGATSFVVGSYLKNAIKENKLAQEFRALGKI